MSPGPITCDGCGRTWFCRVHGDHTTCRGCRKVVYVPPELRAGPVPLRHTGKPIGRPREPKPDKAPRSIARTKTAGLRPDLGDLVVAAVSRSAAARVAERAATSASVLPVAPPVERSVSPVKRPPTPPQLSRKIPPGQPAYRLILAGCQCPLGWPTPDIPEAVNCPRHGYQRVDSCASADGWAGPRLVIPQLPTPPTESGAPR